MNRQPFEKPPKWWSPLISRRWVNVWRPFRLRKQHRVQRLHCVEVENASIVEPLLGSHGILLTPNHCSHADAFTLYAAADYLKIPFYSVMAWQVFARSGWLRQTILRHHGAFSIDREGTDLSALKQAREVLQEAPYPLAIFPEGEVYHLNERLTPFREGPAAIALMAARKGKRPVACVPCGIRYFYVDDPMPELLELMKQLEISLHWRPRVDLSLEQRIYHLAEGMIALKEVELIGETSSGPLKQRIQALIEFLLNRIESKYSLQADAKTVPERVKAARKAVIAAAEDELHETTLSQEQIDDLDDIYLVVQAFSYPGDYVSEKPSVERIAETLDKFEEDVLGVTTATIRGTRRAVFRFGTPIILQPGKKQALTPAELTQQLQAGVEKVLSVEIE